MGHFAGVLTGHDLMSGTDNRHSEAGADWLSRWFGEEVTEPVRLHVAAKRYLCATEPGYAAALSPASRYTLGVQGGPMPDAELARFEASPFADATIRLRRWDDAAKDPDATVPGFDHFVPLLRSVTTSPRQPRLAPGDHRRHGLRCPVASVPRHLSQQRRPDAQRTRHRHRRHRDQGGAG